jgi:hypothetical protein
VGKTEAAGATEEAKGIGETLLQTVGVVDVVLGALTLYGVYAQLPDDVGPLKDAGSAFANNALLVCASALTGKLVYLLACLVAVFLPVRERYVAQLRAVTDCYETVHPVQAQGTEFSLRDLGPEDRAMAYLRHERAAAARQCELIRDNALITYGAAVVALVAAVAGIATGVPRWSLWAGFFLFSLIGWLTYTDFVRTLSLSLRGFVTVPDDQQRTGTDREEAPA